MDVQSIHMIILVGPQLDGLAQAFLTFKLGQKPCKACSGAWLGSAYLGSARPAWRPKARPEHH